MQVSITIEAMFGLNWPLWKQLIPRIEQMGFAGLYRSDHFMVGKTGTDSLELITSLTYLAQNSQRLHFGSLVAPLSFRDPVMLARQAMAIDDLSGGRMILGLGAGWHEEEHTMFGYSLGDIKTRLERFAEGVEVIHSLIHQPGDADFSGRFYQLRSAQLAPRTPLHLLVGGNGARYTLPLAARFADVWNCQLVDAQDFKKVNARLDELILRAGREPQQVKRTMILPVLCVRQPEDLRRHVRLIQQYAAPFAQASEEEIKGWLYGLKGIIGSAHELVDGLAAYEKNGVEEIILEWFGLYDMEGLEALGSEVLPHF